MNRLERYKFLIEGCNLNEFVNTDFYARATILYDLKTSALSFVLVGRVAGAQTP